MSEELLSFGAAVGSPGWSLGIFSLKMHFLLAQPGFFPAEPPESVLIFCISRLCGLWSMAGSLLPRFTDCSELFAHLRSAAAFVTTSPAETTRLRGIFWAGLAAPVGICGLFLGQGSICFQCISLGLLCLSCSVPHGWRHWYGWEKGVGVSVFQPGVVAAMVARGGFCVCGRSQGMGGAGSRGSGAGWCLG